MINLYNKYLNEYVEKKGNLTCYPYLLVFVNFAGTSNTRVDDLIELHDEWKHQMGRKYSQEYRFKCRCECHKLIEYILENYQKEDETERVKPKKGITIHNTIRGVKNI